MSSSKSEALTKAGENQNDEKQTAEKSDIAFIESMDGEGPQGAKGVGEAPSICMAAAAANAIANATGTRMFELPFTPEKVYRALHGQTPKLYWKPWKAE